MFGYGVYMEFTPSGGNGGNQQIVLAAKTGYPRFSDVHGAGSANVQPVSYSIIRDSDGIPVEIGVGYLSGTSGGDQLERTELEATWDGTTYSKLPSSRITLTNGTLYRVYCSHQVNIANLGYRPCKGVTNQHQTFANVIAQGTTSTTWANNTRLMVWPVLLLDSGPFDAFCLRPNASSHTLDLALYRMRHDGDPGQLIVGVTGVTTTGGAINEFTFASTKLDPGWYFIGGCCSSATPAFWQEIVSFGAIGGVTVGNGALQGMYVTYTMGSLPNPFGAPSARGANPNGSAGSPMVPQIRLRRA